VLQLIKEPAAVTAGEILHCKRLGYSTPPVIIGIAGEIYHTPRIGVNIVHGRCSDGMSDRVYPDKVQVTVDGRRFNGCGGL
jgi:hypothetical protein